MNTDNNNFYGLSLNQIDSALKATYNNLLNSQNNNTINSKENQDLYRIEFYISESVLDNLKEEIELPHSDYLKQIEKIFTYRQNKVIYKISRYDDNSIGDFELKGRFCLKNNIITVYESGLNEKYEELLQNFFKDNNEFIVFRKLWKGKIKSSYKRIGQVIFFNSKLHEYEVIENNNKNYIKFNRIGEDKNV